jgi:hypothetical protein
MEIDIKPAEHVEPEFIVTLKLTQTERNQIAKDLRDARDHEDVGTHHVSDQLADALEN